MNGLLHLKSTGLGTPSNLGPAVSTG